VPFHSVPLKKQTGAALLALMLIIIISSSFYLLTKLNTNLAKTQRDEETGIALRSAKDALIGYAVSYPDRDTAGVIDGPGYLPCPDIDNNGLAGAGPSGSPCSFPNTTIGRFPYKTLETEELRDGGGQRLWYALSENFKERNIKTIPLNSESPSQAELSVNGIDDIVAVIFAPGKPFDIQDRAADANDVTNYLEDDNSDLDTSFVTSANVNFNDRLIVITRQELMSAVEKRVLGETSQFLTTYFNTHGAYPWLTPFADPKSSKAPLRGEHDGGDSSAILIDSSRDFLEWGVANGDIVRNFTDGSIGMVTAVTQTSLTIAGPFLGSDNDYDDDDEYYIYPAALANLGQLRGVATNANDNASLEDANNDFNELDIMSGDIVDNLDDGSSGVVDTVSENELIFSSLTGGTDNDFDNGDSYIIRSHQGQVTGVTNNLTIDDANNNFIIMGVQPGDLILNNTDGSIGRVLSVDDADTLTVDELYFGNNNSFATGNNYSLPRYNTNNNAREGLLSIHEVGEAFKTALTFDWTITASPGDITVTDSTVLQNYMQNYAVAGSESFDDSIGACIWLLADIADCYGSLRNFVNISGNMTSGTNTAVITDSNAQFITEGVKRGDIAQDYDDEIFEISGTVDAANSGTATADTDVNGLTLEDTNNNFLNINISVGDTISNITDGSSGTIQSVSANQITADSLSGGADNTFEPGDSYRIGDVPLLYDVSEDFSGYERYSYVIQNNTLESDLGVPKIQGVISDIINTNILGITSYLGESLTPIEFRPGDNYAIYQPRKAVVESVSSETQLTTDNYTSSVNPDFDYFPGPVLNAEYYRIIPAGNSFSGTVDSTIPAPCATPSTPCQITDADGNFLSNGVVDGDVIENTSDFPNQSFGQITGVTETTITVTLYGGTQNKFTAGDVYTIYHDYVYSRVHIIHARFRGNQASKTLSEQRARDVCLGYSADCTALSAAVNFSGNGGDPLITVIDYEEDESTEAGRATFTPTAASSGNIRVSNIDYYLSEAVGEIPDWFISNKWHQLVYIAYSAGDSPNGGAMCIAGTNCLTVTGGGTVNNNKRALVISAGEPLAAAGQDRTLGAIGNFYENQNSTNGDDNFQTGGITNIFNDQNRVIDTSP
jgi:hypothetical protein